MITSKRSQVSTELPSQNTYVDGILWGGKRWSSNKITYSFQNRNIFRQTRDWSEGEIEAMEKALATWESVAEP